jgi:hypothetical protein
MTRLGEDSMGRGWIDISIRVAAVEFLAAQP